MLRSSRLTVVDLIELALCGLAIALAWWLGGRATEAWIARVAALGREAPDAGAVRSLALRAELMFTAGVLVLAAAHTIMRLRARDPMPIPFVVPAIAVASLVGLVVHHATVEIAGGAVVPPSAAGFAEGFLLACVAGAAVLVAPVDLAALAGRAQLAIAVAIGAIFVALAVAGSGPAGSGTRINLGPVQPIELVKPLFVLLAAAVLGRRAAKLRWQRRRFLGLRWPRLQLLGPAIGVLLAIIAGLYVIGDLGPVLVLALVFLAMFFVVTRATGWVVIALGVIVVFFALIALVPGLVDTGKVATRVQMWRDPWGNGLTHGHQLGEGLWAIAAGGLTGQGLAQNAVPLPPAGKTDLVLAPMIEQLGALVFLVYLAALAALAIGGLRIAAASRTPERVLLAGGTAVMIVVQWLVIFAGTLGLLPLTGIVVPFVSSGRSSMVVFVVLAALLAKLALDGRARERSTELAELHAASRGVAIAALGVFAAGAVIGLVAALRDATSARGIVTRLRDGTLVHRQNPRLVAIASAIRRGAILDRRGEPLAVTAPGGARDYPLGAAFGTLLGAEPSRVLRPPWALERALDRRLRGYGERTGGPRYRDYDPRGPDAPLPWPDLREFAPLLDVAPADRPALVAAIDKAIDQRTVTLSIDARLQAAAAKVLAAAARNEPSHAAAAVVIDVDTGQVLARVQVPDVDPGDPAWQDTLLGPDGPARKRLVGAYGAVPDKTGTLGMFQAGSVAKLFTALAAVRAGVAGGGGAGCRAATQPQFTCTERDGDGPSFTRPGWPRPIHDHEGDDPHGEVDLARAIAVSCNVYFAQLGLAIGPEPLVALRAAGADVGYPGGDFVPGAPGTRQLASTAFGQGAMALNTMQAARFVAAIAAGGVYRRCPPTMELDAACPATTLVDDPARVAPILAGMRRVMTGGTGGRLDAPPGVRVYGKTGTADVNGFVGEEPYGIAPGRKAAPHSWFVAIGEPEATPECEPIAPGRLAVAVVIPRGGTGASAAGPAAMKILAAARELDYLK